MSTHVCTGTHSLVSGGPVWNTIAIAASWSEHFMVQQLCGAYPELRPDLHIHTHTVGILNKIANDLSGPLAHRRRPRVPALTVAGQYSVGSVIRTPPTELWNVE